MEALVGVVAGSDIIDAKYCCGKGHVYSVIAVVPDKGVEHLVIVAVLELHTVISAVLHQQVGKVAVMAGLEEYAVTRMVDHVGRLDRKAVRAGAGDAAQIAVDFAVHYRVVRRVNDHHPGKDAVVDQGPVYRVELGAGVYADAIRPGADYRVVVGMGPCGILPYVHPIGIQEHRAVVYDVPEYCGDSGQG